MSVPELDRDMQQLLARGKGIDAAPHGTKARVLQRVHATVSAPPTAHGGTQDVTHGAVPGGALVSMLRPVALVTAFALGGAAGAVAMHHFDRKPADPPPREKIVYVDRFVTPPAPASTSPVPPSRTVDNATSPSSRATAPSSPLAAARSSTQLAAEQGILDVARTALGRGDGAAAMTAVDKHERRFKNGLLAEEREAIAVQALVLLGKDDDAEARGAAFHRKFPGSLLLPVIDAALEKK